VASASGAADATPTPRGTAAQQAQATYQQAMSDLKQGDFAGFGQQMQQLGTLLGQLAGTGH
jgi:uncharacterized membrane protein (UPF0182 family)